jgi:hypothetical protein
MHFLGILMVEQTLCTSEAITRWALASNQQRNVSHTCMTCDCLLLTCPDYLLQATIDSYAGLCFHIVWCNVKGVGDREILETYLNSASKHTSETDIFPHGTKWLLTSVIGHNHNFAVSTISYTKLLDTFLIWNFIFSCGPSFSLIFCS